MRQPTNIYLATLWLIYIKGVWSSGLPRVWWLPGTSAQEGDTIQLQCQVASEELGPAIWLKLDPQDPNNHVLLSHGDIIITEDPRFSVRHHRHDNVYVLKIKRVSAADAGSYQCQVPVSSEEEEELKVEAAPPVVVTLLTDEPVGSSSLPLPALGPSSLLLLLLLLLLGLAR